MVNNFFQLGILKHQHLWSSAIGVSLPMPEIQSYHVTSYPPVSPLLMALESDVDACHRPQSQKLWQPVCAAEPPHPRPIVPPFAVPEACATPNSELFHSRYPRCNLLNMCGGTSTYFLSYTRPSPTSHHPRLTSAVVPKPSRWSQGNGWSREPLW